MPVSFLSTLWNGWILLWETLWLSVGQVRLYCHCVSKTVEKNLEMLTTSWSNRGKRTIKFLFYLLSWSFIIHASTVELYFIAIYMYTSIWSYTIFNIIRIILEVLPCRFSTNMKMFSSYNNTRYYRDIIHWINARHSWNQYI